VDRGSCPDGSQKLGWEGRAIENWRVERLLLDDENFRLPPQLRGASQDELLRHFAGQYDLEEIAYSMIRKGYFEEEPLLTISVPESEFRIVVEGNRRLATLKLLTDEDVRRLVGGSLWLELAEEVRQTGVELAEVPTRNYATRDELLEYLGFRHVSGLMPWTPEAKARYVHALIVDHNYSFEDAARSIGSRSDAIRRQFIAYRALMQAKAANRDVSAAEGRFGVFYRALQNRSIRAFLGLSGWTDATPETLQPLGEDGPRNLEELSGWLFGPGRVVRDSRQIDDLGKVVADAAATSMLREHSDITLSLQELPPDREAVFVAIRTAFRELARANGLAFEFAGDEQLQAEVARLEPLLDQLREALTGSPRAETQ